MRQKVLLDGEQDQNKGELIPWVKGNLDKLSAIRCGRKRKRSGRQVFAATE